VRRGGAMRTPRRTVTALGEWKLPWAVALVVLALPAAGCERQAAPPSRRLQGTYIVHGFCPSRDFGAPCKGADVGYRDIRAGTTVTVRDQTAALLGTATLQGGTLRKGPLRGEDDNCVFSFSLTVPERDAYRIEVAKGRGSVPFSRSDLERKSWRADLTLGAYTMFGGI
jgi:hypothetical protein